MTVHKFIIPLFLLALAFLNGCSLASDEQDPDKLDYAGRARAESELLVKALTAYEEGLFSIAREKFTELRDSFPASPYVSYVELKIGDTFFAARDYESAYSSYDEYLRNFQGSESAHYAAFQRALSQLRQYRGTSNDQAPITNALNLFKEVTEKFPNSPYVSKAKEYIILCQEELAKHELQIAQFYAKQDQLDAATTRVAVATQRYSTTKAVNNLPQLPEEGLIDQDLIKRAEEKRSSLQVIKDPPARPNFIAAYVDSTDSHFVIESIDSNSAVTSRQFSENDTPVDLLSCTLGCERVAENKISITFSSPLPIELIRNEQLPKTNKIQLQSKALQPNLKSNFDSCPELKLDYKVEGQTLEISLPAKISEESILTLDRPHRLIMILDSN